MNIEEINLLLKSIKHISCGLIDLHALKGYAQGFSQNEGEVTKEVTKELLLTEILGTKNDFTCNPSKKHKKEDIQVVKIAGNSIRKRKNNVWELRITYMGERISFYGATQEIVKKRYKEWARINIRHQKVRKTITFNDWYDTWLKTYKIDTVSSGTIKNINGIIMNHFSPYIGKKRLSKIKRIDIQKLFNKMSNMGNSKQKAKYYIENIFEKAYKNHYINENIADDILISKSIKNTSQALTHKEQKRLENWNPTSDVDIKFKQFYLYCLYSGCRRAEALKLKLSDINYNNNTIHIRGSKTQKSDRYIPLFDSIREILKNEENENVFEHVVAKTSARHFKILLPKHCLRDLRKTFATNCNELRVPAKVVQVWLGHSTIDMTLNVYTDVRTEYNNQSAELINKARK